MYIIANPASRKGERLISLTTGALDERGISYSLRRTSEPLHATRLAREAAEAGEELVLCIGGDGTVSEIAGGLVHSDTALGIIPAGTGDDFARYLRIPKDPLKALDTALSGQTAETDAGEANGRVFINAAGCGFDVAVLRHTLRYKKVFHGLWAYVLGVLSALFGYPAPHITIECGKDRICQKSLILSIANGRYIGGGMCVAPCASASDGLFDVQYVDDVPRWKIPFLLAGFISGGYLKWSMAHHFRCGELSVTVSDGSLQLDGEILNADKVHYKILPGALKVKVPRPPID